MRALLLLVVFSAFFVLGTTHSGAAQSPHDAARRAYKSGQIKPLGDVLNVVRSQFRGRVVDVNLRGGVYRVKLLSPSGDVQIVSVDAGTARIISVRGGKRRRGGRR